jgi:Zn ribbon nucleic-acid-binding protein
VAGRPEPADDEAVLVRAANVQLLHNIRIWGELQEQGAGEQPELRLTFAYLAVGEAEAQQLAAFLGAETDYELFVRSRGRLRKRRWFVAGATQPAPVTLDTINAWTEWMIAAGAEHGPCAFDGWAPQESGAA